MKNVNFGGHNKLSHNIDFKIHCPLAFIKVLIKWCYNDNDYSDNSNNDNITATIATTTKYKKKAVIVTQASWNSITDMFATKILYCRLFGVRNLSWNNVSRCRVQWRTITA